MQNEKYIHSEITYKVIGCAMKVHSKIGSGFQEFIYQRCLSIEMNRHNLNFSRELEIPIYYDSNEVGTRRADFLIEDKVMVEIKAVSQLEKVHLAQAINYLEAYELELGLLINFGALNLEFKRVINQKKINPDSSSKNVTALNR